MTILKKLPKGVLPILVIVLGILGAVVMIKLKPEPPRRPARHIEPLVRVVAVTDRTPAVAVAAYGEAGARRRVSLTARVSGEIEYKSPAFETGGAFAEGDTLLVVETADYRLAADMAAAQVAAAELALAQARQEAEIARREWDETVADIDRPVRPNPLVLHEPQLKQARANLTSAEAAHAQALLNLERCLVVADFDGRVIADAVDEGQYVAPGTQLGTIYAAGGMEVVVPVEDGDLAFFAVDAAAEISADYAGATRRWTGRVLRVGSAIDRQSRMVDVLIGVDDSVDADGVELPDGLFVEVRIAGRPIARSLAIPRDGLRPGDTVWIVDDENRLRIREVAVAHRGRDQAVLTAGVEPGERLIVSQMEVVTPGLKVRVAGAGGEQR